MTTGFARTYRASGAVGDVNGEQPFTRVCQEEAKVGYADAFEDSDARINRLSLGHAVFTDPEIGSVGLSEAAARAAGYDVAVGLVTFDRIEKAELVGSDLGLIKYVIERDSRRLLGCHVIGRQAADLIWTATVVLRQRATLDELATAVGIFPTLAEGMEGTARGLLRRVAPDVVQGPLTATSSKRPSDEVAMRSSGVLTCPACGADFDVDERLGEEGAPADRTVKEPMRVDDRPPDDAISFQCAACAADYARRKPYPSPRHRVEAS